MTKLLNKIIKLIDLKTIITLMFSVALLLFTYLQIIGNELFIASAGSIFTYYFNKDLKKK